MVKVLALILSVFLLGLSLVPCADEPVIDNIEISYQDASGGHDHNGSEDFCSPLCICHCCHSHLVVYQFMMSYLEGFKFQGHKGDYTTPLVSGYLSSPFQPPQV
ncbi:hypothetical protein BFP97_16740 [Roseivirga sp. 4D4]|uniref:DUF6660 family protein n=1 Tax=Roseivirga sp. 4D4 TaxID=1889784 RepID=UPI000852C7AF|nr:DUF6660 family protein [Roseivirga sp. 4D4]OEK03066.1 hypothetical protein BFP97_16740 [Roseivirga sp. 4D4]